MIDFERLAVGAVAVLAWLVRNVELVIIVVLVVLVAGVFAPRGNVAGMIAAGCVAGGVAIGWLTR